MVEVDGIEEVEKPGLPHRRFPRSGFSVARFLPWPRMVDTHPVLVPAERGEADVLRGVVVGVVIISTARPLETVLCHAVFLIDVAAGSTPVAGAFLRACSTFAATYFDREWPSSSASSFHVSLTSSGTYDFTSAVPPGTPALCFQPVIALRHLWPASERRSRLTYRNNTRW